MSLLAIYVKEGVRKRLQDYAAENNLSLSAAVRMLALNQLKYLHRKKGVRSEGGEEE